MGKPGLTSKQEAIEQYASPVIEKYAEQLTNNRVLSASVNRGKTFERGSEAGLRCAVAICLRNR